jgi:hypothetical protein
MTLRVTTRRVAPRTHFYKLLFYFSKEKFICQCYIYNKK